MKKKIIALLIAVCLIAVAAIVIGRSLYDSYIERITPGTVRQDLSEYYHIPAGQAMLMIDGRVDQEKALSLDGTFYLRLTMAEKLYAPGLFITDEGTLAIYSTPDEIYDITPGLKKYSVNDRQETAGAPFLRYYDGELYLSVEFLEKCGICYTAHRDPDILMITYSPDAYLCYTCKEATEIRTAQDIKAPILADVGEGEELRVIDGGGIRQNGFTKVMNSDGVRGYILESSLSSTYYKDPDKYGRTVPEYSHLRSGDKIYMGWQLVYVKENLQYVKEAMANAPEMNVLAPTWYYLTGTDGGMISYANAEAVEYAHKKNVRVWATFKNDTIEGKFSCSSDSHTVLSTTESRRTLIASMMSEAERYGFDGINIDFELLKKDTGVYFIQFLRELSVRCRQAGIVLSVDNYVPQSYNAYYDIASQSQIVDYVVIMGYDEHTNGSAEAGSVSSLAWFTKAIEGTLEKAEPDGIIMGLPFYTRLWRIKNGVLSINATLSMDEAKEKVGSRTRKWLEKEGQYYVEYTKSGSSYMIWLEEEESITLKVKAIRNADLAGVAAWKLGDEGKGIWGVIKKTMEKKKDR